MILNNVDEAGIGDNPNSSLRSSVFLGNLQRRIRAAVVDDDVFPVLIGLGQHAFNALDEVLRPVVHRGDNADQRL